MTKMIDFTDGSWKHCEDTYEVVGYSEKTRTIHINKSTRYGIYYDEIKINRISRKLSKANTIKLANHTLDLSKMNGIV